MNGLFSPPGASWLMSGAPLPGMLLWLPIYVLLDAARLGKRGH